MKELIYKSIDGVNPRKKEISIEETEVKKRVHISKKWTCKYFVRAVYNMSSKRELDHWLIVNQKKAAKNKNCHIMKNRDSRTGSAKIICKILGDFFVVKDLTVLNIVYMNSLKIDFVSAKRG